MYRSVRKIIDEFEESWSVLPAFQGARDAFVEKVARLETLSFTQNFVAKGSGATKLLLRKDVARLTIDTVRAIKVYAVTSLNKNLLIQVKFGKSRLYYSSSFETLQLVDLVILKAQEHIEALEDYGVTPDTLDRLIEARDAYKAAVNIPRDAVVERKFATAEISLLVSQIDGLLSNQLDLLVSNLQLTEHEFHVKYYGARVIVNLKATQSGADKGSPEKPEEPDDGHTDSAA